MATTTSSTTTSNLGVGSGLDLSGILEDLREVAETKVTLISNQITQQEARLSAYTSIKTAVEALQTSVEALQKTDFFKSTTATTTSTAFTATSTSDAASGNYNIAISQLAQAQSLYTNSTSITSSDTAIGSGGTITFTQSDGTSYTLELEGEVTLESLAKAINADSSLGVGATVITTGSGENASTRLMLTSKETGTDAALTSISVSGNDDLQNLIGYSSSDTSNLTVGNVGQNAKLTVNGIEIESQSNTVDEAISGITLTLTATNSSAETLTVAQDTSAISTAIQSFVTAYNNVQSVIKTATAFDVAEETQAALTGDSTARSITNKLRQALQETGAGSIVQSLADLGIKTEVSGDNQGLLTIDTDKLNSAIKNNVSDVESLFSNITTKLTSTLDSMLDDDGLFDTLDSSIDSTIDRLTKQKEAMSARIDAEMAIYQAKFVALDTLVSEMTSLSSYLTTQFASLSSSSSSS